jgi:hypothetical protein
MTEEPMIIQMNIDRYRAMLALYMSVDERLRVERLLAEANSQLALATDLKSSNGAITRAR